MKKPIVYPSPEELCTAAADFWVAAYAAAVIAHDSFHVALSGGTTPKKLYEKLATAAYQSKINWHKVHIYFGDERFVPLDHADSNYNMAAKALLSKTDCPAANIHAVNVTSDSAEAAATQYETTLMKYVPIAQAQARFDLVLLGLGPDGHTASLFPDTPAVNEKKKQCTAVYVEKLESWRVSITFTAINNANKILLLSEGSAKKEIIQALTSQSDSERHYPVQYVRQTDGFFWYVDQAAIKDIK